ncbi:M23 family metallopeptidase [Pseudoalteromonas sp. T1lg65]|uniref:M23 family metallopeptidase n=1 Tax=Pseudoalteromonas sp. T1lg65 TaxID=2077101 RepID=UPI003F7AE4B5
MKVSILSTTSMLLMSCAVSAAGQHYPLPSISFSQAQIESLPLTSITVVEPSQFLFSNQLQQEDWPSVIASTAPHLEEKLDVILHYAGYSSINPKLLLALMEQYSQVISSPTKAALQKPFNNLSSKLGFDEQVMDIALRLSALYYAHRQFVEQNNQAQLKTKDSASVALTSLTGRPVHETATLYQALFNKQSLLLNTDVPYSQNIEPQADFYLSFPWPSGYAWYSGGAHSNTGSGYPYSSLDFNNGSGGWGSNTPWVQAAHGGTVTRFSACNIRVTHASGYATQYYHMEDLRYRSGDVIAAGAWLGRYADDKSTALCQGGQSTGPHLHFSLLYNGSFISLHNWYISGYRVDVGSYNYDDNCNRFYFMKNGYRTCAWRALYK